MKLSVRFHRFLIGLTYGLLIGSGRAVGQYIGKGKGKGKGYSYTGPTSRNAPKPRSEKWGALPCQLNNCPDDLGGRDNDIGSVTPPSQDNSPSSDNEPFEVPPSSGLEEPTSSQKRDDSTLPVTDRPAIPDYTSSTSFHDGYNANIPDYTSFTQQQPESLVESTTNSPTIERITPSSSLEPTRYTTALTNSPTIETVTPSSSLEPTRYITALTNSPSPSTGYLTSPPVASPTTEQSTSYQAQHQDLELQSLVATTSPESETPTASRTQFSIFPTSHMETNYPTNYYEIGPSKAPIKPTNTSIIVATSEPGHFNGTTEKQFPELTESLVESSTPCQVRHGSFGSLASRPSIVSFEYEIETTETLTEELLTKVEDAFSNHLLAVLFVQCKGQAAGNISSAENGLVRGLSSWPGDQPKDDAVCSVIEVEGNDCSVIRGELTLYVDRERPLTSLVLMVLDRLKHGMQNDIFSDAEEGVERVSYVSDDGERESDEFNDGVDRGPPGSTGQQQGNDNFNGFVVGLFVTGAATGLFLVGAFLCRRRQRAYADINSTDSGPSDGYHIESDLMSNHSGSRINQEP